MRLFLLLVNCCSNISPRPSNLPLLLNSTLRSAKLSLSSQCINLLTVFTASGPSSSSSVSTSTKILVDLFQFKLQFFLLLCSCSHLCRGMFLSFLIRSAWIDNLIYTQRKRRLRWNGFWTWIRSVTTMLNRWSSAYLFFLCWWLNNRCRYGLANIALRMAAFGMLMWNLIHGIWHRWGNSLFCRFWSRFWSRFFSEISS